MKTMSRYEKIIKYINNALDNNSHLYNEEELIFMKKQLRELRETKRQVRKEERRGFGS